MQQGESGRAVHRNNDNNQSSWAVSGTGGGREGHVISICGGRAETMALDNIVIRGTAYKRWLCVNRRAPVRA